MKKLLLPLSALLLLSVGAAPRKPLAGTQSDAEFALSGRIPRAVDAIAVPPDDVPKGKFDLAAKRQKLQEQVEALKARPLKELVKDKEAIRAVLALDAIEYAGFDKLEELMAKGPKYAAFAQWFLGDTQAMTLYGGAGLVPKNTAVGWRVMADIWAKDRTADDFLQYLSLMTGIAACWGAGPQAERLQLRETYTTGRAKSDPVWRYFFFKQSHKEKRLHKNFPNLRPWEIRFIAGNSWEDESLFWLQRRVNLPPDKYGDACWAASYCDLSQFGMTVQGPLYYMQADPDMGDGQRTVTMGGVCGSLSHVGAHSAAGHGIPAYTCGQPGHCAYGFRLERGKWLGGFGGPDGGPHNWIFPGQSPTATMLMEAAFGSDKRVDAMTKILAFARCGVKGAWPSVAKGWAHNWNVQTEYLDMLADDPAKLAEHAKVLAEKYSGHGFAFYNLLRKHMDKIEGTMTAQERADWRFRIHELIAGTKPSGKVYDFPDIVKKHFNGLSDAEATALLGRLFKLYIASVNDAAFGHLLSWSIGEYVAKGRDKVFSEAFKQAADAPASAANADPNAARRTYAAAVVAAEKAGSAAAVNSLSDIAARQKLNDGYNPDWNIKDPDGVKCISEGGLLTLSTTSGWDRPLCHRDVIRNAPGAFHTDREDQPFALIKLAKGQPVTDVVIVKNGGNEHRSRHLKVSRSTDGATFFPIAENDNTPREWRIHFDKPEPAGWIKVEQINNGKEVFHLRNILVYGKEGSK